MVELEDELNKLNNSTELASGFNNTHELIESLDLSSIARILDNIALSAMKLKILPLDLTALELN